MRVLMLFPLLAACAPDIVPGAYLCGAEQLCPEGQECNGADGKCVAPSSVQPFACDPAMLHEPDDTPDQGFAVPNLACVSASFTSSGCLAAGDAQNFVALDAPDNCATVAIHATVLFPVAWEPLGLQLWDRASHTMLATDDACASTSPVAGQITRCLVHPLTNKGKYAIAVVPAGGGDCDGTCNYNRYSLTLQLGSN
jgi:hypothetical protein